MYFIYFLSILGICKKCHSNQANGSALHFKSDYVISSILMLRYYTSLLLLSPKSLQVTLDGQIGRYESDFETTGQERKIEVHRFMPQ